MGLQMTLLQLLHNYLEMLLQILDWLLHLCLRPHPHLMQVFQVEHFLVELQPKQQMQQYVHPDLCGDFRSHAVAVLHHLHDALHKHVGDLPCLVGKLVEVALLLPRV
jgi:hypothetical protein